MQTNYFESTSNPQYSQFIALSRYARWLEDENRRETWEETVDRYISFFKTRFTDKDITQEQWDEVRNAILNLEVLPSMRALMTAGKALEKSNIAGYNCSYIAIDNPRAFDETLFVLLNGTGLGFSVERQYVSRLPDVAEEFYPTDTVIKVSDSKLGWAKAYRELISLLYAGQIPKWDVSLIRPAGAKLRTFGGRAAGSDGLVDLFQYTIETFTRAKGRKLSSLECHDILCKIGEVVVIGGIRRSALISLSNLSDDRMRDAKKGQFWLDEAQRSLANNSACYTEKPEFTQFMKEWFALHESRCGERGIFNRVAAKKQVSQTGRRDADYDFGVNPCLTGDMQLLTTDGYKTFAELDGNANIPLINKNNAVSVGRVWCNGEKDIVAIKFSSKHTKDITCTPDHRFMLTDGTECEAQNLVGKRILPFINIKDTFDSEQLLAGYILGDGALSRLNSASHLGLEVYFGKNDGDVAQVYGQSADTRWYSREAYDIAVKYDLPAKIIGERGFPLTGEAKYLLSGIYTANGCVLKNGRVTLKTIDRTQLENIKILLEKHYGISSYITTNKAKSVKFSNGDYTCKQSYDLNIARYDSIQKFAEHISFAQQYKRDKLKEVLVKFSPSVRTVKSAGVSKVYDFHEPETHWGVVNGFVTHNCGEILLRPNQLCNLSTIVVRATDTLETLKRKVRLATILGTIQSSLTDFPYVRSAWKNNCEDERLLGVSMTGIMDNDMLAGRLDTEELKYWLDELKLHAIDTNKHWAAVLDINPSTAVTAIKPEGTTSQLTDSGSGIHDRFAQYYIRRVRADKKDPLAQFMKDMGFHCEDDIVNPSGVVFSFPIKAPVDIANLKKRTAVEQLEHWKIFKEHWCEHNVSCTIYYTDDEFLEVGNWVWKNFDGISGVSFLPHTNHVYQQAPYEEITADKYEKLLTLMPKDIDWAKLSDYEKEDTTTSSQTLACTGNVCEMVDLT